VKRKLRREPFSTDTNVAAAAVTVTVTRQTNNVHQREHKAPSLQSDETALVDSLLSYTSSLVKSSASNIIAFSGGVDSSLVAALVFQVFHSTRSRNGTASDNGGSNNDTVGPIVGNVKAVLGVSTSLPPRQLSLARNVASFIGIDLMEVHTAEGSDRTYIENNGQACFICKSHLYSALEVVSQKAKELSQHDGYSREVLLYNGTNADDTTDPTRLGLIAARNFSVKSPLIHVTKDQVRRASRHLNLPNWNFAASPCLRSRLALGVEATEGHLRAVNLAEEKVRNVLSLDETINMRVRMLSGERAMVELDPTWYNAHNSGSGGRCSTSSSNDAEDGRSHDEKDALRYAEELLKNNHFEQYCQELGFRGGMGGIRLFRSGSVSRR
jgi:PP-loop superfamily ATP-utilizing enzyme